jgi:hypothetical protein
LLHLEARFSYEKRMGKLAAIFPRTLEILNGDRDAMFRQFVETCPPVHIGRLENARQFHDFLVDRWRHALPKRLYVRDVAACELACAEVRNDIRGAELEIAGENPTHRGIRRSAGIILLRCAYDPRSIFEGNRASVPVRRETLLVVARLADTGRPQIFEVLPPAFDLLAALEHWTDPAAFAITPEAEKIIVDLAGFGLIEVRR